MKYLVHKYSTMLWWMALSAVLLLFAHGLAHAVPVTLQFAGTMSSGTGLGTFTYDSIASVPTAVNLGGMDNRVYTPFSWDFQLTSTFIQSQQFSSALAGQSGRMCVGICTFGSGQQLRLDLHDGGNLLFHFSFALTEPVSTVPAFNQIGGLGQAVYEFNDGNGARRVSVFTDGALSQANGGSVPLPGTFWSTLIGLAGIFTYLKRP